MEGIAEEMRSMLAALQNYTIYTAVYLYQLLFDCSNLSKSSYSIFSRLTVTTRLNFAYISSFYYRLTFPAMLTPLRSADKYRPSNSHRTSPDLRRHEASLLALNQSPRRRRPSQRRKCQHRAHHAKPRAHLAQIRRQRRQRADKNPLRGAGRQAVEDRPHVHACDGADGRPRVQHGSQGRRADDQRRQGAEVPVRSQTEQRAHGDADGADDDQEVHGRDVGQSDDGRRVRVDVEEAEVQRPEDEEHAYREQRVGWLAKGGPFDERA